MSFNPDAYLDSKAPQPAQPNPMAAQGPVQSSTQSSTAGFDPDSYMDQKGIANPAYETPGEELKTAGEAVARGATLGGSDLAETKLLGVDPKDIKGRMQSNPITSTVGQVAGGAGLLLGTGGLGEGPLAAAAEGGAFSAGNLITDKALGDPDLNAQKVVSEIGMGALLGLGLNAASGRIKSIFGKSGHLENTAPSLISEEAADNISKSETANAVSNLKENTPEIIKAAQEIGAPVTEGMISDDPWVQKAEDALVNGAPTYSGIRRARLYEQGYNAAENAITQIAGEPESTGGLSAAELGNNLKQSLSTKIEQENAPISDLYNEIRGFTQQVPLKPSSLSRISDNIMALDPVRLDPNGPAAQMANRMAKNLSAYESVDDVAALRKVINNEIKASPDYNVRFVGSQITDRLKDLEKRTVLNHAKGIIDSINEKLASVPPDEMSANAQIWQPDMAKAQQLQSLMDKVKSADQMYGPFINKVKTLAEMFGKRSVDGAQSAINFLTEDLSPEQLTKRAFQKGNSEMAQFFAKSFPEEWELVKQYQRAELRDSSVFERTGQFNTRGFLKKVDKLEPEIQKLLFSPDELKKIDAVKTYMRSIPENFNPSGTSGMSAFREFATSPTGAAISNARDFGIEMFIRGMTKLPPGLRPNPIEAGSELANKFNAMNATRNIAENAQDKISTAAKAIFLSKAGNKALLSGGTQAFHSYDEKVNRISELKNNPNIMGQNLSNAVDGIHDTMPHVSQGIQNAMSASVLFLDSKIPRPQSQFMLSKPWEPSPQAKQKFENYYQAVNNPIGILDEVKNGSLSGDYIEAVQSTHPELFKEMQTHVLSEMDSEKARNLPYPVKLSLAKFLGTPLDSSMIPQVIMSNQAALNSMQSPNGQSPKQVKSTQTGLSKLKVANRAQTETQGLEEDES